MRNGRKACAPDNCVIDFSLSNGGGWSKMKVSFSLSSQSILNDFHEIL